MRSTSFVALPWLLLTTNSENSSPLNHQVAYQKLPMPLKLSTIRGEAYYRFGTVANTKRQDFFDSMTIRKRAHFSRPTAPKICL
jgi:hypothetical protein